MCTYISSNNSCSVLARKTKELRQFHRKFAICRIFKYGSREVCSKLLAKIICSKFVANVYHANEFCDKPHLHGENLQEQQVAGSCHTLAVRLYF